MKKSQNARFIINSLKKVLKLKTDKDLADLLDVKANTISTWKRRKTIDKDLLNSKIPGINMNWIYKREGNIIENQFIASELKGEEESDQKKGNSDIIPEQVHNDPYIKNVIKKTQNLSLEQRIKLIKIIDDVFMGEII